MRASYENGSRLLFGQFELDRSEERLLKRGLPVRIENQPFQILAILLEHPGEVISRRELSARLWPEGTYVDFDEGLNTAVMKLRYVLGDSAENSTFIETIPRRGYRFLAPVSLVTHPGIAPQHLNSDAPPDHERTVSGAFETARYAGGLGPRQRSLRLALAGAVVTVAIVGAIYWLASRRSSRSLPELKLRQLTINSSDSLLTSGAISPDGKYLAFADARGMHINLTGTGETRTVPSPEVLNNQKVNWEIMPTAWFPDSTRFLANAHQETVYRWYGQRPNDLSSTSSSVWVVSVLGGAPRKLRDDAFGWSVSPDGTSVSFATNKGRLGDREIWLMGPNGEQARKLYSVSATSAICCLYFFPDGRRVSYIMSDESGDALLSRDLGDGPITTLLPPSEMRKMGDSAWLSDGRLIYSDACIGVTVAFDTPCNYWIERLDARSGRIIEKPTRLTNFAGFWMSNPSVTADGKRVAFMESSGRGSAYVADLAAGSTRLVNPRRFSFEEGGEDTISGWTVDSKTVIVIQNRGDHYGLYKQVLDSGTPEPIVVRAEGGLLEEAPVSPDGKWVIAQVWPITAGPTINLMRVPINGGSPELLFTMLEGSTISCTKPPSNLCALAEETEDHEQMIISDFDPVRGRVAELARFDLDSNYDTSVNNLLWDISPDGTRIATAQGPKGPIQITTLQDHKVHVIPATVSYKMVRIVWASDGKGLFVANSTDGGGEILHLDLKGNAVLLRKCDSNRCFGLPSPDGHHLAIYDWKANSNIWMMEDF